MTAIQNGPTPLPRQLAVVDDALRLFGPYGEEVAVDVAITPWHAEAVYRVDGGGARPLFVMALCEAEGFWAAGAVDGDGPTGLFSCGPRDLADYFGSDECYELLEAIDLRRSDTDPRRLLLDTALWALADLGVVDARGRIAAGALEIGA